MSGQLVVRSVRPQDVPWPVWVTLALAGRGRNPANDRGGAVDHRHTRRDICH